MATLIKSNKKCIGEIENAKDNLKVVIDSRNKHKYFNFQYKNFINDMELDDIFDKVESNIMLDKFYNERIDFNKIVIQLYIAISKKNVGMLKPIIDRLIEKMYKLMDLLQTLIDTYKIQENFYLNECNNLKKYKKKFDNYYDVDEIIISP